MTWLSLAALTLVCGCASKAPGRTELMPAPSVFQNGQVDPFRDFNPQGRRPESEVLYATDRDPAGADEAARHYASRRGYLVRLGRASIEHGEGQLSWEEARRLSLAREREVPYSLRVGAVKEMGVLGTSVSPFTDPALLKDLNADAGAEFAEAVNRKLARSSSRDVVIYVHGFKVPFEDPLLVATELWHFLGYDGVLIPYSWPSTPSLLAYFSDAETASLSAHYLRLFISYLSESTAAERIHVLGYSAGTRVVVDALSMLALEDRQRAQRARLGEVILVGSDYDTGLFAAALTNGILDVTDRLTAYLSSIDGALRFANLVLGRERLGQILARDMPHHIRRLLEEQEDLVLIDVSDAENAGARNGHAYFRESPWVSSDILATLAFALGPAERGLVREDPSLPIWSYPPDFIERLRTELARLSAGYNGLR